MYLTLTPAHKPTPEVKALTTQVVSLINQWDEAAAQKLFARTLKRAELQTQFEALHIPYGLLRLGGVIGGDGKTQTCVRLLGKRNNVNLQIDVQHEYRQGTQTDLQQAARNQLCPMNPLVVQRPESDNCPAHLSLPTF